ncbi:hypothetical protein OSTOST_08697 [Ostertagia ostertagi]
MHEKVEQLEAAQKSPQPTMVSIAIEAKINEERERIAENAEFMEPLVVDEEMDDEEKSLRKEIEQLEAELTDLSRHRRELARRRICRPREYRAGVYRTEEKTYAMYILWSERTSLLRLMYQNTHRKRKKGVSR